LSTVTAELQGAAVRTDSLRRLARRLYLPSFAVAAVTLAVIGVAVDTLARRGQLAAELTAGRAELAAPALVLLVAGAILCERRWPAVRRAALARGHVQDSCFVVVYVAIVVPVMTLLGVGFASLVGSHATFLEASWTARWPAWVVVPLTLVAMDGANWLAHYADHRFGTLWRFHALHHSQEELSVLTSFRANPFMHLTGFFLATIPVAVLMSHRAMAPMLITVYVCLGTLPHANVRWTFGPLGRVVVSPAYHRLHHASEGRQGANLGVVLTVWDVLAGRGRFPVAGEAPCATGLAGRPLAVEQSGSRPRHLRLLASQLAEPFRSRG
jgi:sterol desaturase/sphingolipid hydroxylase (fatty acid hydroxylase superfamily)